MKKVFALTLAALMVMGLVACGGASSSASSPSGAGSSQTISASVQSSPSSEPAINVDEDNATVDVTISKEMVDWITSASEESPEEYLEKSIGENGVIDAKLNDDGSITMTIEKAEWQRSLDEMKTSIDESIDAIVKTEGTSITSIEYNDDLSVITIKADKAGYESNFVDSMAPLTLGMQGMMYQIYAGVSPQQVVIEIVDEATGETFDTVTYPDSLG